MLSLNREKKNAKTSVKKLYNEYTRDEQNASEYDDGHRNIDVMKTKDNVLLFDGTKGNIEKWRKAKIKKINDLKANRTDLATPDDAPKSKKTDEEREQWAKRSNANKTRALRADTVDLITNVVQLGDESLENLSLEQQESAYRAAFEVMRRNPTKYGEPILATIHKDETSMHMQVMTSCLNEETMQSDAKKMFGNKYKMSDAQTEFVNQVNDVLKERDESFILERGLKRVGNPDYVNFKDEMKSAGYEVNRYNDRELMQAKAMVDSYTNEAEDGALDIFDSVQELQGTGYVYNRANKDDANDENFTESHFLTYKGGSGVDEDKTPEQRQEIAESDVKSFHESVQNDNPMINLAKWFKDKAKRLKESLKRKEQQIKHERENLVSERKDMLDANDYRDYIKKSYNYDIGADGNERVARKGLRLTSTQGNTLVNHMPSEAVKASGTFRIKVMNMVTRDRLEETAKQTEKVLHKREIEQNEGPDL